MIGDWHPPLRALVIGTRSRGMDHLAVLRKMNDVFTVAGICEVNESLASNAAERFGCAKFTNLEEALDKSKPDVAVMCVHGGLNHFFVRQIAPAKVHLLIETPVAPTLTMTDLLIAAASDNAIKVEIAENMYRLPAEKLKSRIIESGLLGSVTRVWNFRRFSGTHAPSLLRTYAGHDARQVSAFLATFPLAREIHGQWHEEWEHARIIFGEDVVGYTERLSTRSDPTRPHSFFAIECTGGSIEDERILLPEGSADFVRKIDRDGALTHIVADKLGIEWVNPYDHYGLQTDDEIAIADEWMSLRDAITEGRDPDYGLARARNDMEILMAIGEAAHSQMTIHLPLGTTTEFEERLHLRYERRWGRHPLDITIPGVPGEDWH